MMLGLAVLPTRLVSHQSSLIFCYIYTYYMVFSLWGLILLCYIIWYVTQVAQVLLTLPYSFSQLGMLSGILFQLFYGILGSWTAYLISILYVEYRTRKEREKVNFRSHVIQVTLISLTNSNIKFNCYVYVWCHGGWVYQNHDYKT